MRQPALPVEEAVTAGPEAVEAGLVRHPEPAHSVTRHAVGGAKRHARQDRHEAAALQPEDLIGPVGAAERAENALLLGRDRKDLGVPRRAREGQDASVLPLEQGPHAREPEAAVSSLDETPTGRRVPRRRGDDALDAPSPQRADGAGAVHDPHAVAGGKDRVHVLAGQPLGKAVGREDPLVEAVEAGPRPDPERPLVVLGECEDCVVREPALPPERGERPLAEAAEPPAVRADPEVPVAVPENRPHVVVGEAVAASPGPEAIALEAAQAAGGPCPQGPLRVRVQGPHLVGSEAVAHREHPRPLRCEEDEALGRASPQAAFPVAREGGDGLGDPAPLRRLEPAEAPLAQAGDPEPAETRVQAASRLLGERAREGEVQPLLLSEEGELPFPVPDDAAGDGGPDRPVGPGHQRLDRARGDGLGVGRVVDTEARAVEADDAAPRPEPEVAVLRLVYREDLALGEPVLRQPDVARVLGDAAAGVERAGGRGDGDEGREEEVSAGSSAHSADYRRNAAGTVAWRMVELRAARSGCESAGPGAGGAAALESPRESRFARRWP